MSQTNTDSLHTLIVRWRDDPGGTYQTWFLWEERLKNFRSIRRGLAEVVILLGLVANLLHLRSPVAGASNFRPYPVGWPDL